LAPDCAPLFLTDGFREYPTALLTHYGQWVQPARQRAHSPAPQTRCRPLPGLLYAQVVKTVRRRRVVRVQHRVVFGTLQAVQQVLAACGWQINTSFIERVNLSIRQHVAAGGRRVTTLCKGEDGLRQQLVLYHVYYNFCLPHASVRQPLPQPEPTKGTGSAKQWRPCTPAMAAGLTEHVWSLTEVLLYRVPPWPQPQKVQEMAPLDAHGRKQWRCAQISARRLGRRVENAFRVRMTGRWTRRRRFARGPETLSAAYRDTTLWHEKFSRQPSSPMCLASYPFRSLHLVCKKLLLLDII